MKLLKKFGLEYSGLLLALFMSSQLYSHGLTMTTAELTLRNNNHLTVTVRTSLAELFNRMEWQDKPASLVHLMAEDNKALTRFRKQLGQLFIREMPIKFSDHALISPNLRLPKLVALRRQVEVAIANSLLPSVEGADHDRSNYLVVYVDGFIPKQALMSDIASSVEVVFPQVLADIMISFNRPLVQTLPASEGTRLYQQSFY